MPNSDPLIDETGSRSIAAAEPPKVHRSLLRLKRELSEDEIAAPGTIKLLLELLAQAESDATENRGFRSRFHEADRCNGVLEERLRMRRSVEIVSTGSTTIGAVMLSHAGPIVLGLGITLVVVGLFVKVLDRK